jgi:hypothetical protein
MMPRAQSPDLVFDYTVRSGDSGPDLVITGVSQAGSIRDSLGNVANLSGALTSLSGTYFNIPMNANDTLVTGANSTVTLGNGNDTITAGANSVIKAGNGNDSVTAGANSSITLGNGNDTVFAGMSDIVTLGRSNDTVAFGVSSSPPIGNEVVNSYGKNDVIEFNHALFINYAAMMSAGDIVQSGSNALITDHTGDTVTLTGAAASSLTANNFKFV